MPQINFAPAAIETTPYDTTKRRVALAQNLMKQATGDEKVYSHGYGIAKVGAAALGGFLARQAEDEHKEALAKSSKMQADFFGMAPGGSMTPGSSASAGSPANSNAPTTFTKYEGKEPNADLSGFIQSAAEKHAVDPAYMTRLAMIESGGDINAKNPNSSAGGAFQFIDSTAKQYGLQNKFDPAQATDAAARLTLDNKNTLAKTLGREPTAGELYLAHQQGGGGASKLLANPDARAIDIVGADAIRLNGGDANMTAGQFASKWTSKFADIGGPPASPQVSQADLPAPTAQNAQFMIPPGPTAAPQPAIPASPGAPPLQVAGGKLPDLGDLSPTAVMQLEGPNRQQMLASILQGRPDTAQPSGPDPRALAQALQNSPPSDMSQSGAPIPVQAAQGGNPAIPATMPAQAAQAASGGLPAEVSATGSLPGPAQSPAGMSDDVRRRQLAAAIMADPNAPAQVKNMVMQQLQPNYQYQTSGDGTILQIDQNTGAVKPVYKGASAKAPTYGVVGKDEYGNESYGWIDPNTRTVTPNQPATQTPAPGTGTAEPAFPPAPAGVDPKIWRKEHSERLAKAGTGASVEEVTGLRKEIQALPSYKSYSSALPAYKSIVEAADRDTKSADLNMVYGLAKIMDPTSVVREGEVVMANDTQGMAGKLNGFIQSIQGKGRLDPQGRLGLLNEAQSRMQAFKGAFDTDRQFYSGILDRRKINIADVIPDYGDLPVFDPSKFNQTPNADPHPASSPATAAPQTGKAPVTVNSPEDAAKYPSGTAIMLPDGTVGRVP